MRDLRRLLPFLIVPLGLLTVPFLLKGGPSAYAEDKPTPPAGTDPGMGEPAADPDDEDDSGAPEALNEKVKKAIAKGVLWLKRHQLADGSWGNIEGNALYGGGKDSGGQYKHPAGATALALYTLLKCKESADEPYIKKGFKFIKDKYSKPGSAYECSMVLLAITATADPFKRFSVSNANEDAQKVKLVGEYRTWAQSVKDRLVAKKEKAKKLGWRYMVEETGTKPSKVDETPGGEQDLSSTQLATLALLAAERCGIRTDSKIWSDIATFSIAQQQTDGQQWDRAVYDRKTPAEKPKEGGSGGDYAKPPPPSDPKGPKDRARGFAYIKSDTLPPDEGAPTGGMTACGIGNLQMARYIMNKRKDITWTPARDAEALQCVYDGCAWLDQNWSPSTNPGKTKMNIYHIYYMYCVERAFDLIGNQLLGNRRWYVEMAEQLCGTQKDKGFWNSDSTHKPEEVLDTCFALLVLKRATKGGIPYGSITDPGDEPPVDNRGK